MSILIQDIEGLRRRIQLNQVALDEMKWARQFGEENNENITLDPVEMRLKAEIDELQKLISQIEEASSHAPSPLNPTSMWQRLWSVAKV